MENLKQLLAVHKVTVILIGALILIAFGGIFLFQKFNSGEEIAQEVDLDFDAEGPYALLYPRRDGNALVLSLKRTASYDEISYELAYTSSSLEDTVGGDKKVPQTDEGEGIGGSIDRGVVGTIDTKDKKGEYEQEILLGTCSRNVCKYDKGVEFGTLTLHIKKGGKAYRMITQWHLQQPDIALGSLTSGDQHFIYNIEASREALTNVGFSVINDLTGAPKLPNDKQVLGKVYGLSVPIAKSLPAGSVTLEMAENPPGEAKLYRYDESKSSWQELETKIDGSKLFSKAEGAGIFAVLTPRK